ncbi:MAG: glycosyltransferase family 2 protein [Patescibacteria group bacterium]
MKFSITIGIPAHNEEQNIGYLLKSIYKQRGDHFQIKNILLVCDGCTDDTASVARTNKRSTIPLRIIEHNSRSGKMHVLNEIYEANTSDILITLDADLVLASEDAIRLIAEAFADPAVALAVPHQLPVQVSGFIAAACRASDMLWIYTRMYTNHGNSIHNLLGCATAMRADVAQKVRYPEDLNNDCDYLYMVGKRFGTFRYVYKALLWYRTPATLHDFWLIASRAIFYRRASVRKYFGIRLDQEKHIPIWYKLRGIGTSILHEPIPTIGALILNLIVRIAPYKKKGVKSKTWEMAKSARRAIVI